MLDIKFVRENPQLVKDNIEKKLQHQKVELVDEVLSLDKKYREIVSKGTCAHKHLWRRCPLT